jgi:hypothetical protein
MATRKKKSNNDRPLFFGKTDFHPEKNICWSHQPSWSMVGNVKNLEDDCKGLERQLERALHPDDDSFGYDWQMVPQDQIPRLKKEIRQKRAKLADIKGGKPKLTAAEESSLNKTMKEIEEAYKSDLPLWSDCQAGHVDAPQELRRQKEPHIQLHGDQVKWAKEMGIRPEGMRVSRDSLAKMLKISKAYFGESQNLLPIHRAKDSVRFGTKGETSLDELLMVLKEGFRQGKL